jgi:cob(I)alamin adenosyltransferase
MDKGYTHIYYGNGVGKTRAALGLMFRHIGHGGKALWVSFCKNNNDFISGEEEFIKNCINLPPDRLTFKRFGSKIKWESLNNITYSDITQSMEYWNFILLNYQNYTMLILDEITSILILNLLPEHKLIKLLSDKPNGLEIILTGRVFSEWIKNYADIITKMEEERHYFNNGIMARKGIEY